MTGTRGTTTEPRRRGRPQRLPDEPNRTGSLSFDPDIRLAWLLAVSRLYSPSMRDHSRAAFMLALREVGVTVDNPRISRWESGAHPVPPAVVAGYERVIGRPVGSLDSLSSLMRRSTGASPTGGLDGHAWRRASSVERTERDLDEVFERITTGRATGLDWRALADDVSRYERIYLHPATWELMCDRLVAELTRASGHAFRQRHEAGAALMADPRTRRFLTLSIGRFITDPDAQNVVPALWLLRDVDDPAATSLVLRLLRGPSVMLRHAAIEVAAAMAARGMLDDAESRLVDGLVQFRLGRYHDLAHHADIVDLALHLPAGRLDAITLTLREDVRVELARVRHTRELVDPVRARRIVATVAGTAERHLELGAEPDQMLRRLVREALFHVHWERRLVAGATLSASPYAPGVAQALLDLTGDAEPGVSALAWMALRHLPGHVPRREAVRRALHGSDPASPASARGLITAGLYTGPLDPADSAELVTRARGARGAGLRHAALYMLGMSDDPCLSYLAGDAGVGPAARWWQRLGPALHDDRAQPERAPEPLALVPPSVV